MIDISRLDFHESTVIGFKRRNNDLELICEQVFYGTELKEKVSVIFRNITNFETDATNSPINLMAAEDGEIIFLDISENSAEFVIEWNDYKQKKHFQNGYKLGFESCFIIL